MNLRLAMLAASLAISGCISTKPVQVSQPTADRIAQCGAGIAVGSAIEIKLRARNDQASLSAELKEEIRAVIFDKVDEADRPYIFSRYIDCIIAQHDVNAIIADLPEKKVFLKSALTQDHYEPTDIIKITSYFDTEEDQLKALKITDARETHRQMVVALVSLVIAHHGNIESVSPAMSVETRKTKPTYVAAGVFASLCKSVSGDDPICQTETLRIRNAPKPCDLVNAPMDRAICEMHGNSGPGAINPFSN